MALPPSLFPDRMEYQAQVPVSEYFLDVLPTGEIWAMDAPDHRVTATGSLGDELPGVL